MNDTTTEWASDIDYPVMRAFLWSGIVVVVSVLIIGGVLMHYIPPPSPNDSAEQFLKFVQDHRSGIIAGGAVAVVLWAFHSTWPVPIIMLIRRMERRPMMTYASIAILGSTSAIITPIAVGWSLMAFRAQNAEVVQALIGAFKTGPLAYNGFLSFWVFVLEFLLWMVVMIVMTFRAYARLQRQAQGSRASAALT